MFVDRLLVTSAGPVRCVLLSPLTEEENEVEKGARPRTQPHPGDSFFQEDILAAPPTPAAQECG